jgi:P-type Ca2+ transporter type 2C
MMGLWAVGVEGSRKVPGKAWYRIKPEGLIKELNSSVDGLSETEAQERVKFYGLNELKTEDGTRIGRILARQVLDVMVLILAAAAVIAWATGDPTDTAMILLIVVLNVTLGFSQEYRAEKALDALKKLEEPHVLIKRGGQIRRIASRFLVPGDMMAIEGGNRIPADGRLVEAVHLRMDESHLTGESVGVEKGTETLANPDLPLGDRTNLVFAGTTAVAGRGWAMVTETGMNTELGKVADLLQSVEDRRTPLQERLAHLGKWLAVAALLMTAVIFMAGMMRGEPVELMLLTAISLAVAVIPEGLPAVVTITLALGAQRMIRREGLIRKLPAVETLGCVTTICTDKTGTLTQNLMSIRKIYQGGNLTDVTGTGYEPKGEFVREDRPVDPQTQPSLLVLLRAGVLCADAHLSKDGDRWTVLGDPTEGALLAAGAKAGVWKEAVERDFPRIGEIPFDSDRKLMTTIHRGPEGAAWSMVKGGIEEVLSRSSMELGNGETTALTPRRRSEILEVNREIGMGGFRVLGCAMKKSESIPDHGDWGSMEKDLVFLGLVGMMDPPRPEVKTAVRRCREAGIRPIMITGDHRITAEAIASELDIHRPGDRVLEGAELDAMSPAELASGAGRVSVYARVSPEHKMKIVDALKANGEIVAMTGDGVNDAPALRAADIGVAMGRSGTDVARGASEMILLDDNFATIVASVEEGRIIYDNIRKFTRYMLATNSGEILTMFLAILVGLPLPLLPVQILWMNLVTDGLPALALGVEPPERDVMRRPPRRNRDSLFSGGLGFQIFWVGLLMAGASIMVFGWAVQSRDLVHGRTIVFFVLTMFQMFNVLAIRSEKNALWSIGFFSNPKLAGAVFLTVVLQLAITYSPVLQPVFGTTSLEPVELLIATAVASTVYFAVEAEKKIRYGRSENLETQP